jgi:alkylated DNA repair protein (DNA oxidative demethylase)
MQPPASMATPLPEGFLLVPDVIPATAERDLMNRLAALPLAPAVMRGYAARRRVVHFGVLYGYDTGGVREGPPMPDFLIPLRDRIAALAGVAPETFTESLVTEYTPGSAIGWHRDAPTFGPVVGGISLGAACRMRFRRGEQTGAIERASVVLQPRSAYVLSGPARAEWQHSIPAVEALRYSITFRSVRGRRRAG